MPKNRHLQPLNKEQFMQNFRLLTTLMLMLLTWTVVYSPSAEASVDWIELHGPEKPPPDDGYEFKGASGGNGLGKLGLAAMGVGVVTALLFVTADADFSWPLWSKGEHVGHFASHFGSVLAPIV